MVDEHVVDVLPAVWPWTSRRFVAATATHVRAQRQHGAAPGCDDWEPWHRALVGHEVERIAFIRGAPRGMSVALRDADGRALRYR